jgi:hypothetical protein
MSSCRRPLAAACLTLLVLAAFPAAAAPPAPGLAFTSVKLDGVRLGVDFTADLHSLFPTIVYDPQTRIFHLWVFDGSGFRVEALRYATSSDGVDFTSHGNLSFAGTPFPGHNAAAEPTMEFVRAVHVGTDWKLLLWTPFDGTANNAVNGDYNYNVSANDLGPDPGNRTATHEGPVYPLSGGVFGQTNSPWGLIGSRLFVEWDNAGGVGRWTYGDGPPPMVTGTVAAADLITGTGFVYGLSNPADPLAVYPHNVGRALDQGDGTYGVYYSLRFWQTGARVNKQIYYSESSDGGATWSAPAGLFADGNQVTVDGQLNQGNFSHPEIALVGAARVLYFSTQAADGRFVVVTNAPALLPPLAAVPALGGPGLAALAAGLLAAALAILRRRSAPVRSD